MRILAAAVYLSVMVGVVAAVNHNAENMSEAFLVWSVASLFLGVTFAKPIAIALPLLAILLAVPFGHAERWLGSDAPLISLGMAFEAPVQALIIALGFGGRTLLERIR